jgi:hypothetical protein
VCREAQTPEQLDYQQPFLAWWQGFAMDLPYMLQFDGSNIRRWI